MEDVLLSLNLMESIIESEVRIGSLIIFAAVGTVAYSVSINIDHSIDPIVLKFKNTRRYMLSNGFLVFAIINFVGVLVIFTSILLKCCQFENLPHVIPFCLITIGVWVITFISVRDLLWRIGR